MERKPLGFSLVELSFLIIATGIIGGAGWYVYKANLQANDTLDNLVNISPATRAADATKIVAAGDIACDPNDKYFSGSDAGFCQSNKTYELIVKQKPKAILALGDLQYENGALDKFMASYDKSWGKEKAKTYPALGNHEYATKNAAGYFSYFGNRASEPSQGYYSFDIGKWHAIALNSNCDNIGGCGSGSAQYQWLEDDLKNHRKTCTLAFWHHPRFTSGRYVSDKSSGGRSADFWELLGRFKADVVLVGHDHLYERFAPQNPDGSVNSQGVRQFTVGTGGKVLYQQTTKQPNSEASIDNQFGILSIDLYQKAYKWQFVTVGGKILDAGNQTCSI